MYLKFMFWFVCVLGSSFDGGVAINNTFFHSQDVGGTCAVCGHEGGRGRGGRDRTERRRKMDSGRERAKKEK